jgi:hypothetical protein
VITAAKTAKHPFASDAEKKHGESVGNAGGKQMKGASDLS